MSDDWKARFRELYNSAQERYRGGRTTTLTIFEADEVYFLATIGCSSRELFDFVEDSIKWDDVEYGWRATDRGFPTVTLPGAAVWHVPWDGKDDSIDWQAYYHQRNRWLSALLHADQIDWDNRLPRIRRALEDPPFASLSPERGAMFSCAVDVRRSDGFSAGGRAASTRPERLKDQGCHRIVVLPLFPQYSSAANGSAATL